LLLIGNLYFALLPSDIKTHFAGFIGYIIIGTSYCFFGSAVWPIIPYLVDKKVLGTAYGIALCFQSIGPIFGPIIVGRILDTTPDIISKYYRVNLFLAAAAVIAIIFNVILMVADKRSDGILMASNEDQKKIENNKT